MDKCLKCKNLDTSDIPNLFCKLNCELVNETEFRYCPKDPKSVVEFVEKLERLHKKEVEELRQQLKEKENKITAIKECWNALESYIDDAEIYGYNDSEEPLISKSEVLGKLRRTDPFLEF